MRARGMANACTRAAAALAPPLLALALSIWLRDHIAVDPRSLRASRGLFGPGFWPGAMLAGVAVCATGWLVRNALALARGPAPARHAAAADPATARVLAGIALIVAYGMLIAPMGFAFATLLFVAAWMVLGGVRRPLTVLAVAVLGTATMMWFFAGVALMPLDLGKGAFETATVAVYKALRIF